MTGARISLSVTRSTRAWTSGGRLGAFFPPGPAIMAIGPAIAGFFGFDFFAMAAFAAFVLANPPTDPFVPETIFMAAFVSEPVVDGVTAGFGCEARTGAELLSSFFGFGFETVLVSAAIAGVLVFEAFAAAEFVPGLIGTEFVAFATTAFVSTGSDGNSGTLTPLSGFT